jgi:hypothetical protein
MLPATDEEKTEIVEYYVSQSPGAKVKFLQKIYSESLLDHRHDVWDVHASDGRWWVITNPTNLYSQEQFPNMDLALTFHIGLCLRIPRTSERTSTVKHLRPFAEVFTKLPDASDALGHAQNVADYQAIGMRCREAMIAFVGAAQDAAVWTEGEPPKRADVRGWSELICDTILSGEKQKSRRHLFKALLVEAWTFNNWLTHAQSSTWHDAETAVTTTEHVVGLTASLVIRHIRFVPEECPNCGSRRLSPEEGRRQDVPEVLWERPVCVDCGWTGTPVPVDELDPDEEEIFTRVGTEDDDAYVIPTVPLTHLKRPGD